MRFLHPNILFWLVGIPLLAVIFVVGSRIVKARLTHLGGPKITQNAARYVSGSRRRLKFILTLIGLTLMIFALARPQYGSELVKVKSTGTEVMIALDASLSMLAGDFYPNRLDKAKREIISLVDNLPGESIGLVIFTGQAFVQCPLTIDHDALRMFLDLVRVGIISDTGTNLERAIEKAAENFTPDTQADKVLVIFTDGETQEGDARAAAEKYKDQFRIFTVGVGTAQGEPIPIRRSDGSVAGYKKDQNDQTVISRLNEPLLQEIASAAGGSSYRATPGEQELKTIVQKIKHMEKGETEGNFRRIYDEKFQYFLIPGIIFIGAALFIGERKNHE